MMHRWTVGIFGGTAPVRLAALVLVLVAAGWGFTSRSQAQEGPSLKMKELNRQALADYAAEDYVSAQLGLREALAVGQRAGMANDPLMARLYANLGSVYVSGLKDSRRGARALEAALAIEPEIRLTETLVTPELRELFVELQARVRPSPPTAASSPDAGAPPPPPAAASAHTPPVPPPAAAAAPSPPASAPAPPAADAAHQPPSAGAPAAPASPAASPPPPPAPSAPPKEAAATVKVAIAPPPAPARRRSGSEEPDLPARIPQPLYCPTPDEAPPGERITLHCVLAPEVAAQKVLLYYRAPGARKFTPASTTRSNKGWYRGVIPGDVVQGRSLHFYMEARGATNELVGSAGRDDSPNVVLIREGAVPVGTGLFAGVRFRRGEAGSVGAGEEDPLEAVARDRERERAAAGLRRRRDGTLYVGVGLGAGYGYHGTQRLEFYGDAVIEKGWIPSGLLHISPEIGYQFNARFALSLLARLQVISQSGSGDMRVGNPARGAFALLARPQLLLGPRNLQLNLSGYLGGGDGFRLTVPPQLPKFRRNDSVRGGPLVVGAGLGVLFHITPHVALGLDGRWLVGYPDFAAVADAGSSLQIAF
jgi:hypothetical protein